MIINITFLLGQKQLYAIGNQLRETSIDLEKATNRFYATTQRDVIGTLNLFSDKCKD